jgi:hypothetical protein
VVAAALRDAGGNASVLNRKTSGVVALAARKGHASLVAGAWGCGAFGNAAADVANAWKAAVQKPCGLAVVVFALPNKKMFAAFASAFKGRPGVAEACDGDPIACPAGATTAAAGSGSGGTGGVTGELELSDLVTGLCVCAPYATQTLSRPRRNMLALLAHATQHCSMV